MLPLAVDFQVFFHHFSLIPFQYFFFNFYFHMISEGIKYGNENLTREKKIVKIIHFCITCLLLFVIQSLSTVAEINKLFYLFMRIFYSIFIVFGRSSQTWSWLSSFFMMEYPKRNFAFFFFVDFLSLWLWCIALLQA